MYSPESDLSVIWRRLAQDDDLKEILGLTGATNKEIAERIIKRSRWDDLIEGVRRVNVFFRPSRVSRNQIINEHVLQVDVHVPAREDYLANRAQERVYRLLHKFAVNNRRLYFDGQLGDLPTTVGFFCAGSRYVYYPTI